MLNNLPSLIKAVPDWKTSITVLKCIHEHGRNHHTEQCWCHHIALFDTICHLKWFREQPTILDTSLHSIMKLPHRCLDSEWTAKLAHDFPSRRSVSKVLVRLTDVMYSLHSVLDISHKSGLAAKIVSIQMAVVELLFLFPRRLEIHQALH